MGVIVRVSARVVRAPEKLEERVAGLSTGLAQELQKRKLAVFRKAPGQDQKALTAEHAEDAEELCR